MTYEEAIKILDELGGCCSSDKEYIAAHIAIEAIEKQIPRKPKYSGNDEQDTVYCPSCGFTFGFCDEVHYFSINPSYCEECGQKLDWSE